MMSDGEQKVPKGRWNRLTKIAGAGARLSAEWVKDKSMSKVREHGGDKLLGDAAVKRAAEVFGNLRGVAAKAGQMAAYVDGLVPEEHKEAYERWMQGLMDAAPRSSAETIRKSIAEDLGAPVDELFEDFEDEPIASASIGQVHRARLRGEGGSPGLEVAVKVQHPGVSEALNSDLRNFGLIESMTAAFGSRKFDSKQMLEEFRERLREELDYGLEAERQRTFYEIFKDDPKVVIPRVIDDRSSGRILTTELVKGTRFQAACEEPEEARAAYCETLWRYVFKATLLGGLFNADPHPGNYIFLGDGRIAFLDYGCVQSQTEERCVRAQAVHRAAIAKDDEAFDEAVRRILGTRGGEYEEWALGYVRHCFEPLFASPYRLTRPYAATMVQKIREISARAPKIKDGSFVMEPNMFFMNRLQCGFYSVLARLDAEVDYAAVEQSFLRTAP